MAKITKISVHMGMTIQPAPYESVRADVGMELEPTDAEDRDQVYDDLCAIVEDKLVEAIMHAADARSEYDSRSKGEDTDAWEDDLSEEEDKDEMWPA